MSNTEEEKETDWLDALVNCASPEVYEYIDRRTAFSEAEVILEKLYVKRPNDIFARYLLRTAKQKPDQTLADFNCTLLKLAKDCDLKEVTADQYRDELMRDSFINGILSSEIRQRLLEHKTLTMSAAYDIAVTMDKAKRNNSMFGKFPFESEKSNEIVNSVQAEVELELLASALPISKGVCNRCGSSKPHNFAECRAGILTCYRCGVKGHIS